MLENMSHWMAGCLDGDMLLDAMSRGKTTSVRSKNEDGNYERASTEDDYLYASVAAL